MASARAALEAELSVSPTAQLPSAAITLTGCSSSRGGPPQTLAMLSHVDGAKAIIIGRNVVCDVRFEHKSISRKHAVIYESENKVRISTAAARPCFPCTRKCAPYSSCSCSCSCSFSFSLHLSHSSCLSSLRQVILQDVGAKKGIFLNGSRMEGGAKAIVNSGDKLKFGSMEEEFKVHVEDPPAPVPAPAAPESDVSSHSAPPPTADTSNMTARQIREMEIAEMMKSLDSEQTYTKYVAPESEGVEEENDEGVATEKNSGYKKLGLPVSHEVVIKSANKTITALECDPSGARLIVGSLDYNLRCYNFAGMDSSHRPFRDLTAENGNPIVAMSASPNGEKFVCATSSAQPKVFTRDGAEEIHFVKVRLGR